MYIKHYLSSVLCIFVIALSSPCNAAIYRYSGTVVESTGVYSILIPVGTAITGFMVFTDTAIQSGFVGESDLLNLDIQLGGFCIFLFETECQGTNAPLNLINNIGITFDSAGNVTGGEIDGALFSPSDPFVPWLFDFDAGQFLSINPGAGMLVGNTVLVKAVPIPAAIWLLASASFCLFGWRRRS